MKTRAFELSEADIATLEDASMFFVVALAQAQKTGNAKAVATATRILALLTRLATEGQDN